TEADALCQSDPVQKPFGDGSAALPAGVIPLATAPLHGGLEVGQRVVVITAVDTMMFAPAQHNLLVHRPATFSNDLDLSGRPFISYPTGSISRMNATLSATQAALAGEATALRLVVKRDRDGWIIYAPAQMGTISLPDVGAARASLAAPNEMTLQA